MIIKKLVTLNILYWMPDYENVLQQFTWQTKDIVPEYPRVHKFLNYWHEEIDAVIAEVQIAHSFVMASSKNYTSKGERKSVSNGKQRPSDVSSLETAGNKMKSFKKGRKVWLTISNPNTKETNKKFIKVNASEFWTKTSPYMMGKSPN